MGMYFFISSMQKSQFQEIELSQSKIQQQNQSMIQQQSGTDQPSERPQIQEKKKKVTEIIQEQDTEFRIILKSFEEKVKQIENNDNNEIINLFQILVMNSREIMGDYLTLVQRSQDIQFFLFTLNDNLDGNLDENSYLKAMFYRNLISINETNLGDFTYFLNMTQFDNENQYMWFSNSINNRQQYLNYISNLMNNFKPSDANNLENLNKIVNGLQIFLKSMQLNKQVIDCKNFDLNVSTIENPVTGLEELDKLGISDAAKEISSFLEKSIALQENFNNYYNSLEEYYVQNNMLDEQMQISLTKQDIKSSLNMNVVNELEYKLHTLDSLELEKLIEEISQIEKKKEEVRNDFYQYKMIREKNFNEQLNQLDNEAEIEQFITEFNENENQRELFFEQEMQELNTIRAEIEENSRKNFKQLMIKNDYGIEFSQHELKYLDKLSEINKQIANSQLVKQEINKNDFPEENFIQKAQSKFSSFLSSFSFSNKKI